MPATIKRLRELEEAGIELSRNAHYDLFQDPQNRDALALHRQLKRWAEIILEHRRRDDLRWSLTWSADGGEAELTLEFPSMSGRCVLRLHREELERLRAAPGMAEILAA